MWIEHDRAMHIGDEKMDVSILQTNVNSLTPMPESKGRVNAGINMAASGNLLPEEGQSLISVSLEEEHVPALQQEKVSDPAADTNELHAQVDKANEAMSMRFSNLQFTVAEGTDIPVVRIEDAETGELIRQIPSEEMVALSKALEELKQGMLLEEKA